MKKFNNKNILITGCSRGLGYALTKYFAAAGANLFLIARDVSIKNNFPNSQYFFFDLNNKNLMENFLRKIPEIDILINNAAMQGPIGPAWKNDWDDWEQTINVNLMAPVKLARAAIPNMIKNNFGKIINISGGGATSVRANFSAYSVAKTGLMRFTETLAAEVKDYNIAVNGIAPGIMPTDMLNELKKVDRDILGAQEFSRINFDNHENNIAKTVALCSYLAALSHNKISGKLISAIWDPWEDFENQLELMQTDIYTLRRVVAGIKT